MPTLISLTYFTDNKLQKLTRAFGKSGSSGRKFETLIVNRMLGLGKMTTISRGKGSAHLSRPFVDTVHITDVQSGNPNTQPDFVGGQAGALISNSQLLDINALELKLTQTKTFDAKFDESSSFRGFNVEKGRSITVGSRKGDSIDGDLDTAMKLFFRQRVAGVSNTERDRWRTLREKFRNVSVEVPVKIGTSRRSLFANFRLSDKDYNEANFAFKKGKNDRISVSIKGPLEAYITNEVHKSLTAAFTGFTRNDLRSLFNSRNPEVIGELLSSLRKLRTEFTVYTRTGGSIPILNVVKQKKQEAIAKNGGNPSSPQRFISSAQLSSLVRRRVKDVMPVGPVGGPAEHDDILTWRTGRFQRSIRVIVNYRESLIRYFYNPIYMVHEEIGRSGRSPSRLIGKSIREVTAALFSQKFRIIRGF